MGYATRNIVTTIRPKQNRKYSIIIPAAGMGHRMKKYGPKSLIKLNDKQTILQRQIQLIEQTFRWFEIILVTGFDAEKVNKVIPCKVKTIHNTRYRDKNIVYSLKLGLDACSTENVIIIYGDLVFNKAAIDVPLNEESCAVISNHMKEEEIGCAINDRYLQHMFYGISDKWAQILFLKGYELKLMKDFADNEKNHACFGFEAVNYILENNGIIKALTPPSAKVIDIDTSLDLKRINTII